MILETKTDTLVLEEGEVQESTNMEIDEDSHIFLMRMLSKFYSDGIGSLIRETASNALDSHRASGVTDPIIVEFAGKSNGSYEFSVEDFGCGLDTTTVDNIIKKYGKSTKRNDAKALGAFGLGFKSPLAYSTSFYFIGRKDGVERKWMMYESDDETNKIDLLYEGPTTERNGVKIIVPVKPNDINEFVSKIKIQLAYFESVYFKITNIWGNAIKNENIKIYRGEHFQWSSLTSDKSMHICLDNVYYPIDWDKLGIPYINFPVGLRFSLSDGLFPVPNREQLKYTAQSKEIILNKIKLVSTFFIEKYNETVKETSELKDLFDFYENSERFVECIPGAGRLKVNGLNTHSTVKLLEPKLTNLKYLTTRRLYELKAFLIKGFETRYKLNRGKFSGCRDKYDRTLDIRTAIWSPENVYLCSELNGLKKIYLRETLGHGRKFFVYPEFKIKLGSYRTKYSDYSTYYQILQLCNYPKNEWREVIKEWQSIVEKVTSKFIDVDKMEVPQSWLDERKAARKQKMIQNGTNIRKSKLEGELTGKLANSLERNVSGKNCKFIPVNIKMSEAYKQPYLTIYGSTNDESKFQDLFSVTNTKKVKLIMFSSREIKHLKDIQLHNWIEINKFMAGKHKEYKRIVTAYLIDKLIDEFSPVFDRLTKVKKISSTLGEKMTTLNVYRNNHYASGDDKVYEAMVKVAEEHKLFDNSIYSVYKEVNYILKRLPFISAMFATMHPIREEEALLKATKDLFKYYKQRMNWENYNLPINEDEVIPEETIETELEETLN